MTTTLEQYALGYHSAWERALHRARHEAHKMGKELNHREETQIVDRFFQGSPKDAEQVVLCEICNENIAVALIAGDDPFAAPASARAALESYGLHIKKASRKNKCRICKTELGHLKEPGQQKARLFCQTCETD